MSNSPRQQAQLGRPRSLLRRGNVGSGAASSGRHSPRVAFAPIRGLPMAPENEAV